MVKRIYVQKKPGFDVEAKGILEDLQENLQIKELQDIIILNRYDVANVDDDTYEKAKNTVFSEPQVDVYYDEEYTFEKEDRTLTDEEINAFAGCFYRVIQSIREAKQQQQQNSQT